METRAHYVMIGAFVLIAIASAFLFVLWLGQTQREFDEYDVIFRDRVSGLSVGAAVLFNGIQKGEVQELNIDANDPSVVVARIRVGKDTPVKVDTKAELELVGFTGLAVIQLVGGGADKPLLRDEAKGVPRIEADSSGLAAFLSGSGDIVDGVGLLLSDENIAAFSRTLQSVDKVAAAVAAKDADIAATIENAAKIAAQLEGASARLKAITVNLDAMLEKDGPGAIAEARATLAETRTLVGELRAVVEENREPLAAFADQGLAQVGPAVAEARQLMRTLDQVLREIDRDPRGYLLGESTPRYEAEP